MSQKAGYFRIGLFVLAATGAMVAAVLALGAEAMFERKIRFECYFDESVQGLEVGAPVKFRGVRIGSVERIVFVSALYPTNVDEHAREVAVIVRLAPRVMRGRTPEEFDEDMQHRVRDGMRVRLASAGLTGGMYIEADYVDPARFPVHSPAWKPEYTYFPSAPSTGARIMDSVESVLAQFQRMKVDELASEVRGAIVDLRASVKNDFSPALRDIGKASAELPRTLAEVRQLAAKIDDFLQKVTAILEKDIAPAAANFKAATKDLPETLAQAHRTFKRADNLLTGQQDTIDQILDNLRGVSGDLKELTSTVKKYPATFLFGDPPPRKEKP